MDILLVFLGLEEDGIRLQLATLKVKKELALSLSVSQFHICKRGMKALLYFTWIV